VWRKRVPLPPAFGPFVEASAQNMNINVTLPDGSVRSYAPGATAMDVAKSISEGLARNAGLLVDECLNRETLLPVRAFKQ
jgi:hypothetical protein